MGPVSKAVRGRVEAAGVALRDAGATVDDSARPDFSSKASQTAFQFLLQATMSSRIPDKDFQWLKGALAELKDDDVSERAQYAARPSGVVQGLEPAQRSAARICAGPGTRSSNATTCC